MGTNNAERRYRVTWLVRRLFRAMGTAADRFLADSGLSAADRAVMEFLYPEHELSVPEIARRYDVSRQHVQVTVNRLLAAGLLKSRTNPRHRRSPLILLSRSGRDRFEEIRRGESVLIERLFEEVGERELRTTGQTLEKMYSSLTQGNDK
jgi:DNA-binding MarR family transcriptional regulator